MRVVHTEISQNITFCIEASQVVIGGGAPSFRQTSYLQALHAGVVYEEIHLIVMIVTYKIKLVMYLFQYDITSVVGLFLGCWLANKV